MLGWRDSGGARVLHGDRRVFAPGLVGVGAAAVIASWSPARAADASVEAFYKVHPIELYVGTTPGGGYDLYTRIVGRWLGRHMPGNPAVVVHNMPGAGQLTMTNWLYNVAPRDGTVIGVAPQAFAIEQALGTEGIQYDARKFRFIGRAAPVVEITYTWHTSATKTLEDARHRVTLMGASGPISPTYFYLQAFNALAGTHFKIINGYPGGGETNIAMERGEVEGNIKAWASMKVDNADWLRDKKVNLLVQHAIERAPDMPDVPLMRELGRTDEEREALSVYAYGNELGRSVMATPGIPPERLAALRQAFAEMMQDPELLAYTRDKKIDIGPPLGGAQLDQLIDKTLSTPPAVLTLLKNSRKNQE